MSSPMFTVLTPTFDRAHTLPLVYESLCRQTFTDFEWLVVDDGSSDATPALLETWSAEGRIDIVVVRQENQGKPTAVNAGVRVARGQFIAQLDSDDELVPTALASLHEIWESIDPAERDGFSGVGGLCVTPDGTRVGTAYPADPWDGTIVELQWRQGMTGEKWGCHRTDVFREFPFPTWPGERYVSEGIVWNRMSTRYKVRFRNVVLRVYHDSGDGVTAGLTRLRARNPIGSGTFYAELIDLDVPLRAKLVGAAQVYRFRRHAGPCRRVIPVPRNVVLRCCGWLLGQGLYARDRRSMRATA